MRELREKNELHSSGMKKNKSVDVFVLTSLDDIAWLLNFRGSDVNSNTVVLAYAVITAAT